METDGIPLPAPRCHLTAKLAQKHKDKCHGHVDSCASAGKTYIARSPPQIQSGGGGESSPKKFQKQMAIICCLVDVDAYTGGGRNFGVCRVS